MTGSLIFLLSCLSLIHGLVINCKFTQHQVYGYGCDSQSIELGTPYEVERVTGVHHSGMENRDVKFIIAKSSDVDEFPLGLEDFFPKLETINIDFPNLKSLCNEDLKVFGTTLKNLMLHNSKIEFLANDLFESTPNVRYIHLRSESCQNIDKNTFKPLASLGFLSLHVKCLDNEESAMNRQEVLELIEKLPYTCFDAKYRAPAPCRAKRFRSIAAEKHPEHETERSLKTNSTSKEIVSDDIMATEPSNTSVPDFDTTVKPSSGSKSTIIQYLIVGVIIIALIAIAVAFWIKKKEAEEASEGYEDPNKSKRGTESI